jgi:hypothetical protein
MKFGEGYSVDKNRRELGGGKWKRKKNKKGTRLEEERKLVKKVRTDRNWGKKRQNNDNTGNVRVNIIFTGVRETIVAVVKQWVLLKPSACL